MTAVGARTPSPDRLRTAVRRLRPAERACYGIAAVLVVVGVLHLGVALALPRPWDGPLSWRKPVTFGVAFGSVLAAVTWVTSSLVLPTRRRAVLLGVFAADCVVEVAGITVQAWRHAPSHFDDVGVLNSVIAYALAAGGAVLVVTLGSFALAAFRGPVDADAPMRRALRAGFALLLAGLAAGIAMVARGEQLIAAGDRTLAYATAGYLKLFHGIALNAVVVLPALAWLLGRTGLDERRRLRGVSYGIGAYLLAAAVALAICLARA